MTPSGTFGMVVIDKPAGISSNAALSRIRRALGTKRAGHTGTLDPFATGVLVVAVGRATRLIPEITGGPKRYSALLKLGIATDTQDSTGEVIGEMSVPVLDAEVLAEAAEFFTGPQLQTPPAYSAKKVNGERAYELSRRGEAPSLAPVEIEIHRLTITPAQGEGLLRLDLECSRGTYVRTLGGSIAARLGTVGHLVELRRTFSDGFDIDDAVALDDFSDARLLPLRRVLAGFEIGHIDAATFEAARHGRPLPLAAAGLASLAEGARVALFLGSAPAGEELHHKELVGIYVLSSGMLVPEMVLAD